MAAPKKNKKPKGDLDFENDDEVISTDNFVNDSTSETDEAEESEDTQELDFDADYGRMSDFADDSDDWN